jgi:hypothetical protein
LLAVFNATPGPDTVELYSDAQSTLFFVTINGTQFETSDVDIAVNCLGGNDTVIDRNIAPGNGVMHNISLDMGDGNDVFRNDTTGNIALPLRAGVTVLGGAGDDTLFLDDSVDSQPPSPTYIAIGNHSGGDYDVRLGTSGFIAYNADLEHVSVLLGGSPQSSPITSLLHKPATTTLYVAGAGADDIFTVGGGALDGDADLNGKVDFDDYGRTDAGFANHRTGWVNGDFDYNNVVDFDDYSLIDSAFNMQGARPATARVARVRI